MLFDPQFTEETLWLREVDGLAQSDTARNVASGLIWFPKQQSGSLNPSAFLSAERNRKGSSWVHWVEK